jgi:hypothetical protein
VFGEPAGGRDAGPSAPGREALASTTSFRTFHILSIDECAVLFCQRSMVSCLAMLTCMRPFGLRLNGWPKYGGARATACRGYRPRSPVVRCAQR